AAKPVGGLICGFCCAAGLNAHGAVNDGGTAIEWGAHCLVPAGRSQGSTRGQSLRVLRLRRRSTGRRRRKAGLFMMSAPLVVTRGTRGGEAIVSASPRADTSSSLLDLFTPPVTDGVPSG